MSHPYSSRFTPPASFVRVNGKIRAREVRVIGTDNRQLGILSLGDALNMARVAGVDLVEIAAAANPPVCRLVDFGKFRYEQAKREKESKKHQHANKVKEVQLSPKIDPHDLSLKTGHAIEFLCEDMKVKVSLRFRGREMAHTEVGFQVVQKFLRDLGPYGQPDSQPKLMGKGINVMISPLPRSKRPKPPQQPEREPTAEAPPEEQSHSQPQVPEPQPQRQPVAVESTEQVTSREEPQRGFVNSPFEQLEVKR